MKIKFSHINRETYCPSAKIRFRYTQFPCGSLTLFSQLDILWVLLAKRSWQPCRVVPWKWGHKNPRCKSDYRGKYSLQCKNWRTAYQEQTKCQRLWRDSWLCQCTFSHADSIHVCLYPSFNYQRGTYAKICDRGIPPPVWREEVCHFISCINLSDKHTQAFAAYAWILR